MFRLILSLLILSVSAHSQTLAFERAAHLQRGVNLSQWYAQAGDYSDARIASFTTPADFALIHQLGLDHVRLPITPEPLLSDPTTGALNPEAVARLDRTVAQILAANLNVVLDVHPESPYKHTLTQPEDQAHFLAFWSTFATHFAATDPNRVFLEILNEPELPLAIWSTLQTRAVTVIRAAAPRHTIVATAGEWGKLDHLLTLQPLPDPNILYSFHFYDPMFFTHQGATWATPAWSVLHQIPYPSTPESVTPTLNQPPDPINRLYLQRYGYDHWGPERIQSEIDAIAAWAAANKVPLYCGEFGAFAQHSDPAMRAAWLHDVRTALERDHIGWSMWDYQTAFGLVTKTPTQTTPDPAVLKALGLR